MGQTLINKGIESIQTNRLFQTKKQLYFKFIADDQIFKMSTSLPTSPAECVCFNQPPYQVHSLEVPEVVTSPHEMIAYLTYTINYTTYIPQDSNLTYTLVF